MEFASAEPTPYDLAHMKEESGRVGAALIHLEVAQREVVMLRFQEDMSLDEIAAITGHASLTELVRYTRAADQRRLAESAMTKTRTSVGKPNEEFAKKRKKSM